MNRLILFAILMMIATTGFSKGRRPHGVKEHSPIHIISKKRDTFYFRVEQQLVGGQIQVVNDHGDTIATAPIMRKHALVDFFYEDPGNYTVIVAKGNVKHELLFEKKNPSPYILTEREGINIYQ